MARKVSSTFQGTTRFEVDPGSFSSNGPLQDVVGDVAFAFDLATGENATANPHNHSGRSTSTLHKGSFLGVPICNVLFPVDDDNEHTTQHTANTYAYLTGHPFMLPTNETRVRVELDINGEAAYEVEVRSTSWALISEGISLSGGGTIAAEISGLTGGTLYFLLIKSTIDNISARRLTSYRVYFRRHDKSGRVLGKKRGTSTAPTDTQSSGGGTIMNPTDWDATGSFSKNHAFHAQLSTRLNRKLNTMWELVSGAPVGSSFALVASGATDPAQGAFHDHSRSTYTAEAEIDFPIFAQPLGAFPLTGDSPGYVTNNWGCPGILVSTKARLVQAAFPMPDFPEASASSRLKVAVLMETPDGSNPATTVYARAEDLSGSTHGTERSTTPTWIGGTKFGYAVLGGAGAGTGIQFAGDENNVIVISFELAGAKGDGTDFRVLGYAIYFEV